ncbi:hypothetical protein JS520_00795 [Candidatus Vidania fulgoroideae]|nr:hypothetical protein JS520_00795 [Candidatus Vidania fulgoroideae]
MQFLGLSGAGKTTYSIIECYFKSIYLIDSDFLYEKIYIKTIKTLICKYKEQLFRKIEGIVNTLLLNKNHNSTLGGGSLKCYLLLKILKNHKTLMLTTCCKQLPVITHLYSNLKLQQEREKEFKLKKTLTIKNDK